METELLKLDTEFPIWDKFFMVHPITIIGSWDKSGDLNFAPKHMAMPMSWDNYFGFVCSPRHSTYRNIEREKTFTVSFPIPEQVIYTSLAASGREKDDTKPALKALPVLEIGDSSYLKGSYLYLNCDLFKIIDGFGENSLISGKIKEAYVNDQATRGEERDDNEIVSNVPLIAYLHPSRFTEIRESNSFPFPSDYSK